MKLLLQKHTISKNRYGTLTDIHAVPGERAKPGVEVLQGAVHVHLEEAAHLLRDGGAHVGEVLQTQLQVVLVALEARLLLQHLLGRVRDGDGESRQPLGLVDQLEYSV